MSFSSIKKSSSLSVQVLDQLEEAIRTKRFPSGSRLPSEHDLGRQFGVSRTAIREALRMLSARGLISAQRGRGNFVREVTSEIVTTPMSLFLGMSGEAKNALDVVHARQMIEPPITGWAAHARTDADLHILSKDVDDLIACEGNDETLSSLDIRFHLNIARATHNPIIPLLFDPLHRLLPRLNSAVYANVKDAKSFAVAGHTKILEAIVRADAVSASEAMAEHLRAAYDHTRMIIGETTQ
jgi:GntR family transcriptional repressor for pyruvate dehydrogenase complex